MIKGSKVLVIGGAGLIGSHLLEELIKEDVSEIVIYDDFSRGTHENIETALKDPRVRVFDIGGDILQRDILDEAVKGKDYVFHLAALWLLHCYQYPRNAYHVNIEGTFNILEACVKHKVKKLIFSSSASVYGNPISLPMTEDHPYNNQTFYGASKIAAEHMCRAFHNRYGLDYVGLRYFNVYGARQDYKGAYVAIIMKILERIDAGLPPIVYGDGSQAYDFIYVSDVARANVLAMQSSATDDFFNIATGKQTSIKDLTLGLLEMAGSSLEIVHEEAEQIFVSSRTADITKAREELGFTATIELKPGLKKLIEWRRAYIESREGK